MIAPPTCSGPDASFLVRPGIRTDLSRMGQRTQSGHGEPTLTQTWRDQIIGPAVGISSQTTNQPLTRRINAQRQ